YFQISQPTLLDSEALVTQLTGIQQDLDDLTILGGIVETVSCEVRILQSIFEADAATNRFDLAGACLSVYKARRWLLEFQN
ncbi:hypothetical protein HDU67_005590, partial [Dinochytrium kinnereticum]